MGNPPREPRVLARLPLPASHTRSKLERSQLRGLAPNGTKQNGPEVRIQMGEDDLELAIWSPELSDFGKLEQCRDGHYRRHCSGPCLDHQRGGPLMKRGVRQIDVGQHDDQQHDKYQTAEDDKRRRFDVPPRHRSICFARVCR